MRRLLQTRPLLFAAIIAGFVISLLLTVLGIVYVSLNQSSALEFLRSTYIGQTTADTGVVTEVRLDFTRSNQIRGSMSGGQSASLSVLLVGEKGTLPADFDMTESNGVWTVHASSLPLPALSTSEPPDSGS